MAEVGSAGLGSHAVGKTLGAGVGSELSVSLQWHWQHLRLCQQECGLAIEDRNCLLPLNTQVLGPPQKEKY